MTPELTLRVLFEMYDSGKYITYKQLSSLKSRGIHPNSNSQEFMKAIQEMKDDADNQKQLIYEKYVLTGHDEAPIAMLRKA